MVRLAKNDGSFIICGKGEDPQKVIMDTLRQYTKENNGPLTFEDAAKIPGMIQPNVCVSYYCNKYNKCFSELARSVWEKVAGE